MADFAFSPYRRDQAKRRAGFRFEDHYPNLQAKAPQYPAPKVYQGSEDGYKGNYKKVHWSLYQMVRDKQHKDREAD